MIRLLPGPGTGLDPTALADLYAHPVPSGATAWVRANVVASLDGAATGADGGSRSISTPADRAVLVVLRRAADVVLVGAATAAAEGYRPARTPVAVVSTALGIDLAAPLHTDPSTLLLTTAAAPVDRRRAARCEVVVLPGGADGVDPAAVVAELARRGMPRVLCEGGPRLLGALVTAGLLDELCLTVSPVVLAGAAARVAASSTAVPTGMALRSLCEDGGTLFLRCVRDAAQRVGRD